MTLLAVLKFIHLSGDVLWIGAISAVGLVAASSTGSDEVRGKLAYRVYKLLAAPAFVVALLAGLVLLFQNLGYYFSASAFMHPKLTLALVVIALHHMIGARAKRMASGKVQGAGPLVGLTLALVLSAVGAAFFVVTKPF